MPRISKSEKLRKLHETALHEFGQIQSALRDERLQCLQDRRFYSIAGAQWEGPLSFQFENKPKFEVNKVHLAVIRIFNEYRNNRIDVMFTSKDGTPDDSLAETCASLYRSDEKDSKAQQAYDNAFEEGVGGGFGAWRLRAQYEDEESEEDDRQRIRIEPIFDADSSVFFDLNAKLQDKSDARCCFVLTSMTRAEYMKMYDDDPSMWPKMIHNYEFDWLTPDVVYLAEYYEVEETWEVIHFFRGLNGEEVSHTDEELEEDEEDDSDDEGEEEMDEGPGPSSEDPYSPSPDEEEKEPGLRRVLAATGFKEYRQKKVKRRRIHKYLLNGNTVLEDMGYIAGRHIPIIPFYGKRWFIDNIERCQGHVRLAKDSQRLKNMELSKLAEIASLSSVSKPIFTPEQIAGHAVPWSEDNIKNYAYLLINSVMDAAGTQSLTGPVGYTKVPEIPPALGAVLQLTDADMKEILGNVTEGEKMISHVAGKTVEAIQQRLDMQSFIYISNMALAIQRCGQVWLSMAKELYTEPGRKMKGVGDRGQLTQLQLMRPIIDSKTGQLTRDNDLTRANFDVDVNIGPSTQSKRDAAVQTVLKMLAVVQDPQTQQILAYTALMNMEGEGIGGIRKYARMQLIKAGVEKPTPEEAQQLAEEAKNAPPTPNDEYLKAAAAQAQAKAQLALADQALVQARTEKTKADTIAVLANAQLDRKESDIRALETLAGINLDHHKAAVDAAESLHGMLTTPPPDSSLGSPSASGGGLGSNNAS